jgi:ecdysteroid kinase
MPIKDPLHPDEVTPEWLTHALRSGGIIKEASVTSIKKEMLGEGKGFLSSVLRVSIGYDKEEPGAPSSVVVKIEPEEGEFHDFGEELNVFEREIRFYRDVAQNVPVRLPVIYYTVGEPPAYSMVMEDLSSFTPGDQVIGMHTAQVMDTVEIIARIQAVYWNNNALERLDWMPDSNKVSSDYPQKWESFVKHFGAIVDPKGLAVGEKLTAYLDWKKKEIDRRPKTIVHSDLREDNLLFGPPGSDTPVLILDWQIAVRSIGAFDVARLISGSEIPKERTGHEFEVLRKWHGTLIEQGISGYSWDDAVYDFRLGALAYLCYPVHFHSGVIGAQGRTKKLAEAIITRAFSSVAEIDAASVLPG